MKKIEIIKYGKCEDCCFTQISNCQTFAKRLFSDVMIDDDYCYLKGNEKISICFDTESVYNIHILHGDFCVASIHNKRISFEEIVNLAKKEIEHHWATMAMIEKNNKDYAMVYLNKTFILEGEYNEKN